MLGLLLLIAISVVFAQPQQLTLSNVFGSNMVLQRDRPAPIWGWAPPGAVITTSLDGTEYTTTADTQGLWRQVLPAQPANLAGREITISTPNGETIIIQNVVFGDVILCSGQSNMEFTVNTGFNASSEIAAADNYPHIRVFSGPLQDADTLLGDGFNVTHDSLLYTRLNWSVASNQSIGCVNRTCAHWEYFSAVCWFAIRDLFDMLGGSVPVGGIVQSYGGTSIQYWMSAEAITKSDAPKATQCCGQNGPASCLWNTQIYPYTIGPMQLLSVLWYQGEQNANDGGPPQISGGVYSRMLDTMIADWREKFQQPNLPFGVALLAAWVSRDLTSFPLMRLAQANITTISSSTFIFSAIDRGDPVAGSVHSPYKQDVGKRAALGVGAVALGENTHFLGPRYLSSIASATSVTVTLQDAGLYGQSVLINDSIACPTGFSQSCESFAVLATPDCVWMPADAFHGDNINEIILRPRNWTSGHVPLATRGYFANWPLVTITNQDDIPAVPWLEYVAGADESKCPITPL